MISISWGYSSVVEHLTADQEVPGSNPGAPCWVANFKTRLLLFIFVKLISFLWMKTKSLEKVVPIFSPLTLVDFGKTKVLTSKWSCCCLMLSKWSMQILDLKSWLQTKADQEIYRFKSSCPLWTWNIWNIQSEAIDVVKMKYVISLLLF